MILRTTAPDTEREDRLCRLIEDAWGVRTVRTGYLDGFDLIGVREGKTVFVGEIKNRNVPHTAYPTIFLAAHKWLKLVWAAQGLDAKAIFFASFSDGRVLWADLAKVDARRNEIAGRTDRPDAPNDQELVIHVPTADMRPLPGT